MKSDKLVPTLRFPEFKDCGEWEEKKLGEIAKLITEKQGNNKYLLLSVDVGKGLVSQKEKFGQEIAGASSKNYFVIRKNDFAYNKSATKNYPEGYIALYDKNETGAVPNSIFTCFAIKDSVKVLPLYLNYLFGKNLHGQWLKKYIAIGGRAHGSLAVNNSDLFKLPIPLPKSTESYLEQQKIADCLSSLDELISAQSEKIAELKTHKQGLMQKLFPSKGAKFPKLRFPEFKDCGEWEERKLGEIAKLITEKQGNNKYLLLSIDVGKGLVSQKEKFGQEIAGASSKNYFVVRKNDFAYNKSATKTYPEGYIALYNKDEIGAVPNSIFTCFTIDCNKVQPLYLNFLFEKNIHGHWLKKYIAIGGRAHGALAVNNSDLLKLHIPLPKNTLFLPEQQKIADCLTSLDELIEKHENKLKLLKEHKKGLMQGLFPNCEE